MNSRTVVLLSIPGLRARDLGSLPRLLELSRKGLSVPLRPSFPAVASSVQTSLTTGVGPGQHGVIANGFYWREKGVVEMWPARNDLVEAPQVWETLKQRDPALTSALWFPLLAEGAQADFVCTSTPRRQDASSCYTKPAELAGALRESLGDFPLKNFRGPQSTINSTAWIVDSFVQSAYVLKPRFNYVCLPHLESVGQKFGPDSTEALNALGELDMAIGALVDGFTAAGIKNTVWLAASEYCITPVSSVGFPNRVLREAGLLTPVVQDGREQLVPGNSRAFALVDHQLAHVYVRNSDDVQRVAEVFRKDPSVARVLVGEERATVGLNHPRSGEVVLIARPESWFAYSWWLDDASAPEFATTAASFRKPGYDPLDLFADADSGKAPLDVSLVKGSCGALDSEASRDCVFVSSEPADWFAGKEEGIRDVDVSGLILNLFGQR